MGQPRTRCALGPRRDYVEMQCGCLQQGHPEDYVIATGSRRSVRRSLSSVPWSGLGWLGLAGEAWAKPGTAPIAVAPGGCASTRAYFRQRRWETLRAIH